MKQLRRGYPIKEKRIIMSNSVLYIFKIKKKKNTNPIIIATQAVFTD